MKKKVAIVGVTGSVGQEFVQSLKDHPWFEVTQIAASERSAGKKYVDSIKDPSGIIKWEVGGEIPEYIKEMTVKTIDEINTSELDLVFSAVESEAARDIETKLAKDVPVISTSSAYRYEDDVPILIPGINDEQAELLEIQKKNRNWKGWVAPLPNCTTTGLAITMKPLYEKYGAKKVMMTSMQASSGGGRTPGVSAMDVTDNIIPYIPQEWVNVLQATIKILGQLKDGKIEPADLTISCTCTIFPVIAGHTSSFFFSTSPALYPPPSQKTYEEYNKSISVMGLPSAPKDYYAVHDDPTRPQPRIDRNVGDGMTTSIGRLEKEELFDHGIKYMLFSHNKKMGSAKGAILLAEMLYKKDKI